MPLVVEKTMVTWVLETPGKGQAMVRLVVVVVPVPVVESEFERAISPMDKWRGGALQTDAQNGRACQCEGRVVVLPMAHAPPFTFIVSVRVFPARAAVMRSLFYRP